MKWDTDNPLARALPESVRANQALNDYAAMGAGRSIDRLFERYQNETKTRPTRRVATLKQWSSMYDWQARVARHQELLNEKARADAEAQWLERRRSQRETEWQLAEQLIDKARQMLGFPLAAVERDVRRRETDDGTVVETRTIVNPARWSFRDAAAMVDTASKLARLAAELETARGILDVELSPADLEKLSDEELDDLDRRLLARRQRAP